MLSNTGLPVTGLPALDRYLADGYSQVRGMSSRFSATIAGHLMLRQTQLGLAGNMAEIGTFQGRFFIALAMALAPGEKALGIDLFDWPNDGVMDRFLANCDLHGLERDRTVVMKIDSASLTPADILAALGGPVRFFHVDGEHTEGKLSGELELAAATLHPQGILCLDDMLHPAFPTLSGAVHRWLAANPDMRVFCIADREDLIGASKYLICRKDAVHLYEPFLLSTFADYIYPLGANFLDHSAIVLSLTPGLPVLD